MNFKKERSGNWRTPEKWSTAAERAMEDRRKDNTIEAELNPSFTRHVSAYYSPLDFNRVVRIANTLVNDIYYLDVLPKNVVKMMLNDTEAVDTIGEDLFDLLHVYGNCGLVYASESPNTKLFPDSYVLRGGDVLLVADAGMPVKEFLFWYIGVLIPNVGVINEWSGIPSDQMEHAYKSLLEFFRNEIHFEYRMYNRRPTDEPEDCFK